MIFDVIRPPRTIADVELWNECYLRWIPAASVTVGFEDLSYLTNANTMAMVETFTQRILES